MIRHHLEEIGEGIIKNLTKFSWARHLWKEMLFTFFFKICFDLLKKEYISNFKQIIIFETLFSPSFDVLHSSSYGPHRTYLSGSTFILHQKGRRKSQSIFPFSSRGWNTLPGASLDLDLRIFGIWFGKQSCKLWQSNCKKLHASPISPKLHIFLLFYIIWSPNARLTELRGLI